MSPKNFAWSFVECFVLNVFSPNYANIQFVFYDSLPLEKTLVFHDVITLISMDTSSSIRHRLDVKISRGKFVEITSILKGETTCKLWHQFDEDISTWIWLWKSSKYQWILHVDFSMSFRLQIEVTYVLAVSILSFSNIFCSGNLF